MVQTMRLSKSERNERSGYIQRRAMELARSGNHENWLSVEIAIRSEGYDEARRELDQAWLRDEIDKACRLAKKMTGG